MTKLCGAEVAIIGLEADLGRLKIATQYGCEGIVVDATEWAKRQDGLGVDCVIDAAGVSKTLRIALDLVQLNGQITKVGWGPKSLNFSLDPLVQKNVRLQGSFSHNWPKWEKVLSLLASRRLDVSQIIGSVWSLTHWQEEFEQMHSRKVVKRILKPN